MNEDPPPPADSSRPPAAWPLVVLFTLLLAALLGTVSRRWDASLLDRYEFRQIQTALSAYWIKQEGFQLAYPTPLFGPPWSIPMEFPTYQACVAQLSKVTTWPIEPTGRLVSLLFFLAALPAVFDLLSLVGLRSSRRLLVLGLLLLSPVYLFYTRAVMIETTALCLSVWSLALLRRTLIRPSPWLFAGLTTVAVLAALTKITTFAVYCVPAAALALWAWRTSARAASGMNFRQGIIRPTVALLPFALAMAVTYSWVRWGDALKHSNPYTGFLASTELHRWNYGDWGLRFEAGFWKNLQDNVTRNILAEGALALALVAGAFATRSARLLALASLAGFFAGPLVFANLYHVHDYYYTANALLLVVAAAVLIASAWDNPRVPTAARWLGLAVVLAVQFSAFDRGYHYYYWKAAPTPPGLADIVRATVPTDGVLLISGDDWNPLLPYYSKRRAVMVAGARDEETQVLEDVISRLPPRKVAAMILVGDKLRNDAELIRARVTRFGLAPRPFASGPGADLYLPADRIADAVRHTEGQSFGDARVLLSASSPMPMDRAVEQDLRAMEWPIGTTPPYRARSQFGVNPGTEEGRKLVYAHAPCEVYVHPPVGARRIEAVAGLIPTTYAKPLPEATDGIIIEIFEMQPDGLRRSLLRRALTPATRESDRGPQTLSYEQSAPFTGDLVFTLAPGPDGNLAYDQGYWSKIEIR